MNTQTSPALTDVAPRSDVGAGAVTFKRGTVAATVVAVAFVAAAAGYGVAQWRSGPTAEGAGASSPVSTAPSASVDGRRVLYWYDPMKPEARFDKPGKSPFMDMDLVPRYADEVAGGGAQVDARLAQSLGLRQATVTREVVSTGIEAVGTLGFNERDVAIVQTRTTGFVERVYARAPGDVIAAGAPLADVLVPEWGGAQQEYLAVRATGETALAAAARQRLVLLGMPEAMIREVERSGQPRQVMTIAAPVGGVIQELMVRAGMSLAPGMTLARINGLATMWLEVAVPEVHAALLTPGAPVKATLSAYPGETFDGRIAAVLPEAARETHTLRVRIELPNRSGKLKAGMYAQASIGGEREEALVVPSEAVIRTGQRAVVFVAGERAGQFSPVDVELGREVGSKLVVLKGLVAGQQVVASGQFLIDSEASVTGMVGRSAAGAASATQGDAKPTLVHEARGVIEAIGADEVTLRHEPVPALKWPAMSMPFALKSAQQTAGLKVGDRVRFGFSQGASGVLIERIAKETGQ